MATLLLTWAAIYGYVGAYYCALRLRRPTQPVYLVFAMICFSLGLWTVGAALGVGTSTGQEAVSALQLQYVGGFATVVFFADFAQRLVDGPPTRFVAAAYLVGALGVIVNGMGWLIVPVEDPPAAAVGGWTENSEEPGLSIIGWFFATTLLLLAARSVWMIARGIRDQPDLRGLLYATAIAVVAGAVETVARVTEIQTLHLVEHLGLLPVMAVSFTLLRRFVHTADKLEVRTDQLRRSYGELHAAQGTLLREEHLAAVGQLTAVVAHEVRNPLAVLKNAISSLRRPTLRSSDRSILLNILDEEVDRLTRLMRDLLAYARPPQLQGEAVDLAKLAMGAVGTALVEFPDPEHIEVEWEMEDCPAFHGDRALLAQVLVNLIDNALAAMPNGGRLTISLTSEDKGPAPMLCLSISDTGQGMAPEVLTKALNPFFTTRAAGTGLGLAIVEQAVRNHGGSMALESLEGEGTTVSLLLKARAMSGLAEGSR